MQSHKSSKEKSQKRQILSSRQCEIELEITLSLRQPWQNNLQMSPGQCMLLPAGWRLQIDYSSQSSDNAGKQCKCTKLNAWKTHSAVKYSDEPPKQITRYIHNIYFPGLQLCMLWPGRGGGGGWARLWRLTVPVPAGRSRRQQKTGSSQNIKTYSFTLNCRL